MGSKQAIGDAVVTDGENANIQLFRSRFNLADDHVSTGVTGTEVSIGGFRYRCNQRTVGYLNPLQDKLVIGRRYLVVRHFINLASQEVQLILIQRCFTHQGLERSLFVLGENFISNAAFEVSYEVVHKLVIEDQVTEIQVNKVKS